MFWGCTLESGKRYAQEVEVPYHITMAALKPDEKKKGGLVSVMVESESNEYLLCTLKHGEVFQVPLDHMFGEGTQVAFFTSGDGVVHLTGYLMPDEELPYGYDGEGSDEEVSELSDEENAALPIQKRKLDDKVASANKKIKIAVAPQSKKENGAAKKIEKTPLKPALNGKAKPNAAAEIEEDSEDEDSYEDMDDDDESGEENLAKYLGDLKKLKQAAGDDDSDSDEEESDDDDESDDVAMKQQGQLKANLGKVPNKQQQTPGQKQQQTPGQKQGQKQQQTPKGDGKPQKNQTPQQGKGQQQNNFKGGNKTPNQGNVKTPNQFGANKSPNQFNKNKGQGAGGQGAGGQGAGGQGAGGQGAGGQQNRGGTPGNQNKARNSFGQNKKQGGWSANKQRT